MINYILLTNFCAGKAIAAKNLPYERQLMGTSFLVYSKVVMLLLAFGSPLIILSRGNISTWGVLTIVVIATYFVVVFLDKRIKRSIEKRKIFAQYKELTFWQRFGYATLGWFGIPFVMILMFLILKYFDDILGW